MSCSGAASCTCGCCSGISQETPATVQNRPGLPVISCRVGSWSQFRDTLLARISLSGQPQLRQLRTRENDDFTIALLDAFSAMADVLTFHTERYANESYLRTATEEFSVQQLAALVGYRPSPGVAADTQLAFTIDPSSGAFGPAISGPLLPGSSAGALTPYASQAVAIPIGTRVQSVPNTPNELPQNFETVEEIDARAAWNAISPRLSQPQTINGDQTSNVTTLILAGSVTNLKTGDPILILQSDNDSDFHQLRTVRKVTVAADAKTTRLDLDGGSDASPGYQPTTEQPSGVGLPAGTIASVSETALGQDAVNQILKFQWDAGTLAVLAQTKKWPIEQLEAALNQQIATNAQFTGGAAYVLRQQAAAFGFNLPLLETPPFSPPATYDPLNNATLDKWGGTVYLDNVYTQIVPRSFAVLQTDDGSAGPKALKIASVKTVTHQDFNATVKVSAITTDAAVSALTPFHIRGTSILCQSEALPLTAVPITDDVPNADNEITLDRVYLSLSAGQLVAIYGRRTDLPGTTASEVRTLRTVTHAGGFTIIKLDEALEYTYLRSTVTINANVAKSTHGARVSETLGNGDGTQTFQSFPLKQAPLTYVSADTPSGIQSTLQIYVDQQLWTEVPYFYGHGPTEHIYITRQDDHGVTTVTFGDGEVGSRLPSGTANVTATYRYGIGTPGLVDSNQISLLTTRPLGVRAATNPLPSIGGADAETLDDSRTNATLTIMALDRVVSLGDYESFARAFTGIRKALAVWIWTGQDRTVLLTVAGVNGAIVDTTNLSQAIANSSEPGIAVKTQSYTPIFFRVAGTVAVLPDSVPLDVQSKIEAALRSQFSFDAREFGQAVNLSEVVAVIQGVKGVLDVDLTALYRSNDPSPSLQTYLPAQAPQGGSRTPAPAELLSLDPGPLFPDLEVSR